MEFLLLIGGLVLFAWIADSFKDKSNGGAGSPRPPNPGPYTPSGSRGRGEPAKSPHTFRPTASARKPSSIKFVTATGATQKAQKKTVSTTDLEGLHDAFTGAPLNPSLGLYQCQSCTVFYHTESFEVLKEANGSRCVSCQSTSIIAVIPGTKPATGRDYTPTVVTLKDFTSYVGSVVTFEGVVHAVRESKRGNDFAVMFENKPWTKGFKLVFFRGAVEKVGGRQYLNSLAGKTIRVRGLIVQHQRFGYEIIVSEKSMILSVS